MLWIAVSNGHGELSVSLTDAGGDENILPDREGRALIGVAAMNGHATTVRAVIRSGLAMDFGIQQVDSDGRTPLALAAMNGHVDVVAALLKARKSQLCIADFAGRNPLSLAAQNGYLAVLKELQSAILALEPRDYGIANPKDRSKRSRLSWAVEYGWYALQNDNKSAALRFIKSGRLDENGRQLLLNERLEWVLEEHLLGRCFLTLYPHIPFQVHQSDIINKVKWLEKVRKPLRLCLKVRPASPLSAWPRKYSYRA